jgi:uncharacterized protein involved in exopolysaccharide biosynthesis
VDIAIALRKIWSHKFWLIPVIAIAVLTGLSVAYKVTLIPPNLEKKSFQFGSASTEVLVDSERSSIAALEIPLDALSERAGVFGQLLRSNPVRGRIASELGVPEAAIAIDTVAAETTATASEPSAAERAQDLGAASQGLLVFYRTSGPVIEISTQAPTGRMAARLANTAAGALSDYLDDLQAEQGVVGDLRVQLTQIGTPIGSDVNQSADKTMAVLAGLAIFALGVLLILLVPRFVEGMRRARELEHAEWAQVNALNPSSSNGHREHLEESQGEASAGTQSGKS